MSNENKFTPGPWAYREFLVSGGECISWNVGPIEPMPSEFVGFAKEPPQYIVAIAKDSEANAKLIAAAPEQHELLTEALDLVPRIDDDDPMAPALADWCRRVKAAILKATGKGEGV